MTEYTPSDLVLFEDSQSLLSHPMARLGFAVAGFAVVVGIVLDTPQNTGEAVAIGVSLVVLVWIAMLRMRIRITSQAIEIRLGPMNKSYPLDEVVAAEVVEYHPLRQFGGWGWRYGRKGSRQYAMVGTHAVEVAMADGRKIYIGANDLEALGEALSRARGA